MWTSLVCNIGFGLMQLCSSNSPLLLVMCKGSASDTLDSVLLLGVGNSFEEKEGEVEGEVVVEEEVAE